MAVIAVVCVAALGLMGLKFVHLPGPTPVAPGDALKIEVVAPVEPKLAPGSVMDVGELVDGFRYVPSRPATRAPVYEAAWSRDEDFARDPSPSRSADVRRYASADAYAPPPEPEPPRRERARRWFGFDNPLPDYGAERRARQARLDALEDQRREEFEDRAARRRYSSEPPRYEERRDERRHYNPPRRDPPASQVGDGPYGPEVG
ncbi:MAG: hypothetical protein ACXW3K_03275 [Brevundimonas sp.]